MQLDKINKRRVVLKRHALFTQVATKISVRIAQGQLNGFVKRNTPTNMKAVPIVFECLSITTRVKVADGTDQTLPLVM